MLLPAMAEGVIAEFMSPYSEKVGQQTTKNNLEDLSGLDIAKAWWNAIRRDNHTGKGTFGKLRFCESFPQNVLQKKKKMKDGDLA